MSFNFSTWAIKSPVPTLMLFAVLTVAGSLSFKNLNVQDFPDIDVPTVVVSVGLPGGTPAQMETEVTRKIEDAVASLGKVDHIRSTVTTGSSRTSIEFDLTKDSSEAVDDVREAVSRVRSQLPSDVNEPQVSKVTVGGRAMLTYAIEGEGMSAQDLSWFIDNAVTKRLLAVSDVASVNRQGGVERELQVNLDPVKLQAVGATAAQVSTLLKATQQEASSGSTAFNGMAQAVRTDATAQSEEQLENLTLGLANGVSIRLGDVARIEDTNGPKSQTAFFDGKEVVSFQVFRARGAGDVAVATQVRKAVDGLAKEYPNLNIREVSNNVDRINKSYEGSMNSLYEGAFLAILVVFLFLKDWRATFVSAVALPLSIIPTFFVMDMVFGFSLNTVTLLAITLIVGVLVDDAIVEVENIVRHLRMGKSPVQAAIDAAQEIGLAVVATTLTLVAVFLPTAFMGGIPGKFFKQFGWTAAIAVLASLLVARLLTPMMAAYMLKAPKEEHSTPRMIPAYLKAVTWCLRNPWTTLGVSGLFFAASLALLTRLPAEFMPASDNGQVVLNVEVPPGTLLPQTVLVAKQALQRIEGIAGVSNVYIAVGSPYGGVSASSAEARTATLTVALATSGAHKMTQQAAETLIRKEVAGIAGAKFSFGFGGSGEKYAVALAGDDAVALTKAANEVERDLANIPGLGNVSSSASLLRPEVVIRPDWALAAKAGVTTQALAQTLRVASAGDSSLSLSKLNLPERQLAIRVQMDESVRTDLQALRQLRIPSKGGSIELSTIADVSYGSGPAQIDRLDRRRNVTLSVELNGMRLGTVAEQVAKLPTLQKLPAGVTLAPSGDMERMKGLFSSFGLAMAAGVLCVYMVLVLLFHSFAQPAVILAALPLSAGGAFGALALFDYSLSMPVLIGLLMLMGIVTKNSILLVEYAVNAQREHGLNRVDAMLDACAKRAQPIVMTTVAMAAGMLPIALGYNGDAAFRSPMATAVIGGLLTSTVLSLLVVPVVYEQVDKAKVGIAAFVRRLFQPD
jgi:multidrug efflux pump subunit AcrB